MEQTVLSPEEVARKGQALYDSHIRPLVDTEANKGKFVVLDVETGDYEIDAEDIEASMRLLERSDASRMYGLRIGHDVAYEFLTPYVVGEG